MSESDHPCGDCAYYLPPVEGDTKNIITLCIHPKRIKSTNSKWTTPNRRGRNCHWFEEGKQLQLVGGDI